MWEPFGTAQANRTAYWKTGSNERSTYSILSTCIITLLLCVYTSLHLNIPEHGRATWSHQLRRRALWILVGICAPEIVAYTAFKDWSSARALEIKMDLELRPLLQSSNTSKVPQDIEIGHCSSKTHISSDDEVGTRNAVKPNPRGSERRFRWTRVHSHFALMGGYAFDTSKMSTNIFNYDETRKTIKPLGLLMIAKNEPNLLPDLPEEVILDKSKANGFAKLLVCVQACWFSAQVIERLATNIPVSLLELNTLLHAFCCLFIYVAWWNKPLGIDEPILIDASEERASKVCAWMTVEQGILETPYGPRAGVDGVGHLTFISDLAVPSHSNSYIGVSAGTSVRHLVLGAREHNTDCNRADEICPDANDIQWELGPNNDRVFLKMYPGQMCYGSRLVFQSKDREHRIDQYHHIHARISPTVLECLKLNHGLRKESETEQIWMTNYTFRYMFFEWTIKTWDSAFDGPVNGGLNRWTDGWLHRCFNTWIGRWAGSPGIFKDRVICVGIVAAGALYGGIHLLAWNGPFSSWTERWMWRVSCFIIVSPVITVPFWIWKTLNIIDNCLDFWKKRFGETVLRRLLLAVFLTSNQIFILLYSAARVYLIVECFINLAHLPLEVYKQPEWSKYIPHFNAG